MTLKLYDENAYATEFEGKVLGVEKENDMYKVLLDQTLFFPLEGGQSCDKGTLDGKEVLDVKIVGEDIFHYLKDEVNVGDLVKGCIDFKHRFSNMQLHSGEHIFSGLVYKNFGFNNIGFHLSDNRATIDVDGKLSEEDIYKLEKMVNEVIVSNIEVKATYPSKEELSKIDYRSKKELSGPIRIVEIENVDICACCAPHVKRTGEIGLFKVINFENYKSGVRIYYLCGFRAIADYETRINDLREISRVLSAKAYEEKVKVKELLEENNALKFQNVNLLYQRIEDKIKSESESGKRGVYVGSIDEAKYMRHIMDTLHRYYEGTCYLFCGNDDDGYRYLIESENENLNELSTKLRQEFGAKGGGKPNSIQGSVTTSIDKLIKIV